jgi:hypothetical protein
MDSGLDQGGLLEVTKAAQRERISEWKGENRRREGEVSGLSGFSPEERETERVTKRGGQTAERRKRGSEWGVRVFGAVIAREGEGKEDKRGRRERE